jgi:hypothetical protein
MLGTVDEFIRRQICVIARRYYMGFIFYYKFVTRMFQILLRFFLVLLCRSAKLITLPLNVFGSLHSNIFSPSLISSLMCKVP